MLKVTKETAYRRLLKSLSQTAPAQKPDAVDGNEEKKSQASSQTVDLKQLGKTA
jgi:hypothetical protein